MNREQLLDLIGHNDEPLEIECVGVKYSFDFCFKPHHVEKATLYEIGRNDVDVPLVVDAETRHVYFLDDRGLSFLNSSFRQMIQSFEAVNVWDIPDNAPDDERSRMFGERMLAVDENCFSDPEAAWSTMREEIGYGVI